MAITTVSSRQFNQDASAVKKASQSGPVFITDRGRPAHVLLTYAAYKNMCSEEAKIADLLALVGMEDIDFLPLLNRDIAKPAEFP